VDVDFSLDYGLTLLAALLIGTGFVLQQNAAAREPASRFLSLRLMTDLVRTPSWLAGIAAMISGQVLAAWSIGHLTLSVVEPLLTTNLIWALILAVPLSRRAQLRQERQATAGPEEGLPEDAARGQGASAAVPKPKRWVRAWEVAGAAVLCIGVWLLSSARSAKPIGLSFGSFSHWPAAAAIAAIAFICAQAGRRRQGRARALLTGIAAGLVYGIQDALTRQTLEALQSTGISGMLETWAPYALVGAGAIGIWLMQSAFSSGSLQMSLPPISAGEPLVGILLGIIVFGDRIQVTPLQLGIQAGGIAALVAGVILVARAPALSEIRGLPHPSLPTLPHPSLPGLSHRATPDTSSPNVTSTNGTRHPAGDNADDAPAEADEDHPAKLPPTNLPLSGALSPRGAAFPRGLRSGGRLQTRHIRKSVWALGRHSAPKPKRYGYDC
jgi:hypothetical protein